MTNYSATLCKNNCLEIRVIYGKISLSWAYILRGRTKIGCLVFLLMPFSLVSANNILVDESGMVSVYSGANNSSPVAALSNESISATLEGAPVKYIGEIKQFELFSQFSEFGGQPLDNNQAYLTWWGVGHRLEVAEAGSADGDTFTVRITRSDGSFVKGNWEWQASKHCWQDTHPFVVDDPLWCFRVGQTWVSGKETNRVGPWSFQLYYNGIADPDTLKEFEVIGMDMVSAGLTSLSGRAGTTISQALKVKVIDYDGTSGAPGQPVRFSIDSSPGVGFGLVSSYTSPPSGTASSFVNVTTDSNGIAKAYVELGTIGGSFTVTATSSSAPIDPPQHSTNPVFSITSEKTELDGIDEEKNQGESRGGKKDPCVNVGNPINVATGNKFQKEVDLIGTSASPLEFIRYYNLTESESESLGSSWRHTYDRTLSVTKEGNGQNAIVYAYIKRPDGRAFTLVDSGNGFIGEADIYFQLVKKRGKWELTTAKDTVELYDGKGVLLSITDSKGNVLDLDYDIDKLLISVVSSSNELLEFRYDATGLLIGIDYWASNPDPAIAQSLSWSFGYTDSKLTSVNNPDGSQRQYHYENTNYPHALTGITDERGVRYATWEYDETGIGASSFHGLGANRVDIAYDVNGLRTVTDSLGNVTDYGVMAQLGQGILTDREGPACTTGDTSLRAYSYDPITNNKLSQTIDGTTTQFGDYDLNGNPGYQIEAVGTPSERRTDYTYDTRFHSKVTSITEPSVHVGENKVSTMEYDEFGNLIRRTVDGFKPDGTPVSRTTTFEYNGPYHQLSQVDGPRTDVSDITTFEYYADDPALYQRQGMLLRVTGPEGIVLRDNLQYNGQRQLISETRPNGLVVTYDWEPNTDRLAAITETVDADSRTSSWTYLLSGEVETFTQADGSTLSYEYDEARRLVRIVDALGNYIDYNLDTEGNILNESTYDPNDILAKSITRSFDVYNRLDVMTQANESLDYDYAADGTLAKEVNGNAIETRYSYDELKRLTTTMGDANGTDPDTAASQTDLDYDSQDNLAAVTDPLTSVTTYTYDDLGNRVSLVSPDTGTASFNHDDAGNRIQTTDAKGQTFTFSYDVRNRLTFSDAPGSDHDIQYTYDSCANGVGKLCSLTRGANSPQANTTAYTYNGFGDVVSMDQDVQTDTALLGASLGISYDSAGRIQSITYPGNTSITYGYDVMGNVIQLTLDRNGLITELISNVSYQAFGPLKAVTLGNGLVRSIDRDQAYRITAINDPVYDATLSYDNNGNILYQSRNVGDLGTGYDALDKLTTATGSLDSYAYSYDRNANRLTDTLNGTLTGYNYEPLSNRLTQVGLDPVILDANGNTTQLRGMTLDYSPDNRLIAANDSSFGYNGIGERVLKTAASKITVYHYGLRGQLMAELNDSGQVEKAYIYLNGQPFAVLDYATDPTGALYYIHGDHLGTPQGLTDQSGNIVWLADYSPFGLAVVNDDVDLDGNLVTFNLRFAGQYFDGESGLHYNYFRDYDPSTGRYVQSDPVGLGGGLNTYAYVGGNPLKYTDPKGLLFNGCHINEHGYQVCDDDGPKNFGTGDASAFPESTNNQCVLDCIGEGSNQEIIAACGSLDVAISLLSKSNTVGAAAGGTCSALLTTMSCTLDCTDDGDCE